MPGAGPIPKSKRPPLPHPNQQCQKKGTTTAWPEESVVVTCVFVVTPAMDETDEVITAAGVTVDREVPDEVVGVVLVEVAVFDSALFPEKVPLASRLLVKETPLVKVPEPIMG